MALSSVESNLCSRTRGWHVLVSYAQFIEPILIWVRLFRLSYPAVMLNETVQARISELCLNTFPVQNGLNKEMFCRHCS